MAAVKALLQKDWSFAKAALPELERFLLAPGIYWELSPAPMVRHSAGLDRLSLGSFLLSLARLRAFSSVNPARAQLDRLVSEVENIRGQWRANWSRKAAQEFPERLHLWVNFLDDAAGDALDLQRSYPRQVSGRVILDLLAGEIIPPLPTSFARLERLDQQLRDLTQPGVFVWEPELAGGFPESKYWYLYASSR